MARVDEYSVNNAVNGAEGGTFYYFLNRCRCAERDNDCKFQGELYEISEYGDLYCLECNSKKCS